MKFLVKQKVFAVGDDFKIYDEAGKEVYYVDGKAFGRRFIFQDMQGKELALIKKQLFTFAPTYRIDRGTGQKTFIKKALLAFRPRFIIDVPGPNDYTVQGNFWNYEYKIFRNRREVAHISKKFFSHTDSYGVNIKESADSVLLLSSAIVIDMVLYNKKR